MTSIDEQIAFIDRRIHAGTDAEFYRGILASLERLKSLDAQLVPVEPEIVGWLEHHKAGDNIGWERVDHPYAKADALIKKSDYDSLQSALKLAQEERDNEKEVRNCISRAYEAEQKRAEKAEAEVAALRDAVNDAPAIFAHMLSTSRQCPPMRYLLTHDGLYGFHTANLWVRNDGKEYTMEADWADNCGKLVKRLTKLLMPSVDQTDHEAIYAAIDSARAE